MQTNDINFNIKKPAANLLINVNDLCLVNFKILDTNKFYFLFAFLKKVV